MRQILAIAAAALCLSACTAMPVGNSAVPEPAKRVDFDRYQGRWYEFARYENRFERNCAGVTAEYARREDGLISVLNTCRKGAPDGPVQVARGRARPVGDPLDAKLKVSFFGPFYGDYWVLDRAEDYSWAIVGEGSGRYLWVLTRAPIQSSAQREALLARVAGLGYDTKLLHFTAQSPKGAPG
jgi:apolipoprotein D and lipocalin family protein